MAFHMITGRTAKLPGDLALPPLATAKTADEPARFQLPFPPSVNHLYSTVRGRRVLSAAGRAYHNEVAALLPGFGCLHQFSGPLCMEIAATFPDHRRRDIDNLGKAVLDSLKNAGIYADDSQIKKLTIEHVGTAKPGWVQVTITRKA